MKISKLFHCLYALVMLLPIFAIGSTCLISTFNMASKEESEIHYKYQTNEVNSNNDLISGNIYNLNINLSYFSEFNENSFKISIISGELSLELNGVNLDDYYSPLIINKSYNLIFGGVDNIYLQVGKSDISDNYMSLELGQVDNVISNNLVVLYEAIDTTTYYNDLYTYFTFTTFNEIDYVETHNINAEEVFYRSVDKVVQSPLFNWAYDSFLVAPFSFIVNLFSMPTNSVIVELLSYWLAISIIWLVFDLIMYIPLLVHRWLDKGVLE